MSASSVRGEIGNVCSIAYAMDQEQILDIILSRGKENTGNKEADYRAITANWSKKVWTDVIKEFYDSYRKADLSKLMFAENIDTNKDYKFYVNAQKDITGYKKAPDYYYLSLVNREMKPADETASGQSFGGGLMESVNGAAVPVLCAVYAAVSQGENYGSACYPPQAFIDAVLGGGMTPSEFYATCMNVMNADKSFEKILIDVSKDNKSTVKKMISAYKDLMGRGGVIHKASKAVSGNKAVTKAAAIAAPVAGATAGLGRSVMRKGRKLSAQMQEQQPMYDNRYAYQQSYMPQQKRGFFRNHNRDAYGRDNSSFTSRMRYQSYGAGVRRGFHPLRFLYMAWIIFLAVMSVWVILLNFQSAGQIMDASNIDGLFGVLAKIPIIGYIGRFIVAFLSWVRPILCVSGLVGALGLKQWRTAVAVPFAIIILPICAGVGTFFCAMYFMKTIQVLVTWKTLNLAVLAPRIL